MKRLAHFLAVIGLLCLCVPACSSSVDLAAPTLSTPLTPTPERQAPIQVQNSSYSVIAASSFQELTLKSPLIVIGQVTEIGEVINAGRDVNDETKPSIDYYGVGQIYKFQIEKFLKGQGDLPDNAIINILVFEGLIINKPVASITQDEIDQERINAGCVKRCNPMVPGTRYLLFLDLGRDYLNESHQYYILPMHPWMFPLTNPDYVMAEDTWKAVYQFFPPQPLDDILWQIENPDAPYVKPIPTGILATPIPVPDMRTTAYPYPNP